MASSSPSPTHKQYLTAILVLASIHVLVSLAFVVLGFSKDGSDGKNFYEDYGKWVWVLSLIVTFGIVILAVQHNRVK